MLGSSEGQYVRLEVINGKNIKVPSCRIPAGIYVSVKIDSRTCWRSGVRVLSSDNSVAWGDTLTISPNTSPRLSLEIWASFELGRMLGHGEVVSKLETSWNELLDHGEQSFDLSFPTSDVHSSLTLKATVVHAYEKQDGVLFSSIVDSEIAHRTDGGHTQFEQYMTSKRTSHLNDAVKHFQWVLDQCPVGHPDRTAALTNLAWACLQGYIRRDLQDIDSTISLFRNALALRPQDHPDYPLSLYHLTEALNWRHDYKQTTADIREAAQLYHELLPLCPEGTFLRRIAVGESGIDYVICNCNKLPMDICDEGIQLRRIVLELCLLGHKHCHIVLNKLSEALCTRFQQSGSIGDIDESIQLRRQAVSLSPEGHPTRAAHMNNLAFSLECRFRHQGESRDLDEAISLYEEVLRLVPAEHESRASPMDNLGLALYYRFNQHGDISDINRAISLIREVLTLRPSGHPSREIALNNISLSLKSRYDQLHALEDLDEAIDLYRESLRLKQLDNPERHVTLFNLSSSLCSRFMQTQKNEDIEEAIGLCQESLVTLPPLHPDRYFNFMVLQEAYLSRYRIQYNSTDLSLAVENFRLASKYPTQGFPERIREAIDWACQAEIFKHESALEAYQMCLELFDNHVLTRSSIISRRNAATAFRGAKSLPVDAASCAVRHIDLQRAVELEEYGRGQQWSLASRLRTPLDDIQSVSLPLAHKLSELSKRLSEFQGSVSADQTAVDQTTTEYRRLTTEWEAVVAEIRNLQGFSRFLLPPSYKDLQAAARHGPVIILIASRYSCNAVIVPTSGEPHHVPLPSLTLADLKMLKDDFVREIRHASLMGPTEPRTGLRGLLRTVWDEIMLPIVNVLQHDLKLRRRSRIWLCPTAAFTSIPLHAAHPCRTKPDNSGRELCLEDIYICSYTPTLSALIRARQTMKMRVAPSFVAIGQGQPGAGQGEVLASVDSELELVCKLVPSQVKFTILSGEEATQAGALDALRCNTWVHLACHGKQDREQPYNSRFAMRDKPLTLLDIMENDAPQAEFAFLSACHTAVGDEETADEVIHLAAGLQFSGFKSVIGTLWVVDDAVAKHIVEAFYQKMFKDLEEGDMPDCTKAASALNHATYAVKNEVPLEQRIVFIHIGV